MSVRPACAEDLDDSGDNGSREFEFDSRGVHLAFLNIFTYLLQDYRKYVIAPFDCFLSFSLLFRYLIHPSHKDPTPIRKFRTSEYLHGRRFIVFSAFLITAFRSSF